MQFGTEIYGENLYNLLVDCTWQVQWFCQTEILLKPEGNVMDVLWCTFCTFPNALCTGVFLSLASLPFDYDNVPGISVLIPILRITIVFGRLKSTLQVRWKVSSWSMKKVFGSIVLEILSSNVPCKFYCILCVFNQLF